MPLPLLLGGIRAATSTPMGRQLIGAGLSALGVTAGGRRRRRRSPRGLTSRQKADLLFVKTSIGKTAAAEYMAMIARR